MMPWIDAHCHLHDVRLLPYLERLLIEIPAAGIATLVTNGTHPDDWEAVAQLVTLAPGLIVPAYGVHPWRVPSVPADWRDQLRARLEADPRATVGEIGLDAWIENYDLDAQLHVFRVQLELAAELERPVTIHCLRAWGALLATLRSLPKRPPSVLIHSPGASPEIIRMLARLGAFFSASGYYGAAHRKTYHLALDAIPDDRLLIETDAPDMLGPPDCRVENLATPAGQALNSPLNLPKIYEMIAARRGISTEALVELVSANFAQWRL